MIHGHKNWVFFVKWNQNCNWVLTSSKDQIIKVSIFYAGFPLAWHPFHEEYFVSGSYDGSICHWLVGCQPMDRNEKPHDEVNNAHESSVWDLAWHPIGYILYSYS
ncbi:hypothetical protein AMTRI_Chr01g129410 [Amborella trichopoda]